MDELERQFDLLVELGFEREDLPIGELLDTVFKLPCEEDMIVVECFRDSWWISFHEKMTVGESSGYVKNGELMFNSFENLLKFLEVDNYEY